MNIHICIYQLLLEKVHNTDFNDEQLGRGIDSYIKSEKIAELASQVCDDGEKEELIRAYMLPLLKMPERYIVAYFENYDSLFELKMVSGNISDVAYRTYCNEPMEINVDELEEKLTSLLSKLYKIEILRTMLKMDISENILDLDYIKGKTEKKSIRLMKRIEKTDGAKC